jgi:hypothetical protein
MKILVTSIIILIYHVAFCSAGIYNSKYRTESGGKKIPRTTDEG